jgi:hypothetical protein
VGGVIGGRQRPALFGQFVVGEHRLAQQRRQCVETPLAQRFQQRKSVFHLRGGDGSCEQSQKQACSLHGILSVAKWIRESPAIRQLS